MVLNMWWSSWKADLSVRLQVNVHVDQCLLVTASVLAPSVLTDSYTHAHTGLMQSNLQTTLKSKCLSDLP